MPAALEATIAEMVRTKDEHFGNGRDIRTLYQKTIRKAGSAHSRDASASAMRIEACDIPPISEGAEPISTAFCRAGKG